MDYEQIISEYEQEHYGGRMPAHNKAILRQVLAKQEEIDALSLRDYTPADEGMHWSD